ncbi:uncharacterized protein LOC109543839 [Dendroctonus ponderosae]|nr:uncharacterized protein LOC109543839 [Dendroctonus ponderosae]
MHEIKFTISILWVHRSFQTSLDEINLSDCQSCCNLWCQPYFSHFYSLKFLHKETYIESMAGDKVSTYVKPQLRGLLASQIKVNLGVAVVLCTAAAVATKILVNDRRKEIYANFYKNYNIDKEFETMRKKGLFDSC